MINPDIEVHFGEKWTCHVCGRTRDDRDISVRKFTFGHAITVTVNVRYCNDTPSCFEGTTEVGFMKSAQRAFGT